MQLTSSVTQECVNRYKRVNVMGKVSLSLELIVSHLENNITLLNS